MKNKKRFRLLRWILNRRIFKPARVLYGIFIERMEQSIRFELVVVFALCFFSTFIFYNIANDMLKTTREQSYIKYNSENIINDADGLAKRIIGDKSISKDNVSEVNNIVSKYSWTTEDRKVIVTDLEGKIIYKSSNVIQKEIDIYETMRVIMESKIEDNRGVSNKEQMIVYPVTLGDDKGYLFIFGYPTPEIITNRIVESNSFLALVLSLIVFIALFIYITNNKMKYLQYISDGLKVIAKGDLNHRIEVKGQDELKNLAENINFMAEEIERNLEAERRAEITKNELITNVSHDLRTPLTSIMGYIGLVRDGKYKDINQLNEYLNIAFNKSERLKILIEDLFEYTKLTNAGIILNKEQVNINEFMSQLIEELMPLFDKSNKSVEMDFVKQKVVVNVDTVKILRVFENLLTNAIKYSNENSTIKVSISLNGTKVLISVSNTGENIPREKLNRLFDRFYRVDESRTNSTGAGGSGLGLAISKNIIALHQGEIWADCIEGLITFFVELECVQ